MIKRDENGHIVSVTGYGMVLDLDGCRFQPPITHDTMSINPICVVGMLSDIWREETKKDLEGRPLDYKSNCGGAL